MLKFISYELNVDFSSDAAIALMWDQRWALGSIERVSGKPAARCCKIAKDYWASRPGEHKRPLVEELP